MKKLDEQTVRAAREDARALEVEADATDPYPPGTRVSRPNRPSRIFNLRLTEEQFADLQNVDSHYLKLVRVGVLVFLIKRKMCAILFICK